MKRSLWVAAAVAAAGMVAMAPAQADTKMGVVNFERLLKESPQGKAVDDALRADVVARQRELQGLQAALKAKSDKLEKDGATMTADQRSKAEKEIRDGSRDLSQKQSDYQEELTNKQNEELSRLQSALVAEVQSYALSQKFDLVVASGGVVYASSALDLTDAVLASLKARAASAPAAAPKPAAPASK